MANWGPFSLEGQRAIVTGAARGIGLGIARRLREAGAGVLLVDLNGAAARDAAAQLGPRAFAMAANVVTDAAAIVDEAVRTLGGVDILVNNAGIYPGEPTLELSDAVYSRTLDVNLRGPMFCCIAAARRMLAQGTPGSLITIGSGAAITPVPGLVAYAASKAAILGMNRTLAAELTPKGIRVNCIMPGSVATEGVAAGDAVAEALTRATLASVPAGRQGTPEDIANAVVFLASPAASYITGVALSVDGGSTL
ncbi:MAG: SDR family NAD(P)-dependent oxidoreductase [Gammaproteobacteria bacterium]